MRTSDKVLKYASTIQSPADKRMWEAIEAFVNDDPDYTDIMDTIAMEMSLVDDAAWVRLCDEWLGIAGDILKLKEKNKNWSNVDILAVIWTAIFVKEE